MNDVVPNSWIWSRTHRAPGRIVDVDELWGQRRYRVWLPSLNAVLLHREEEIGEPEQSVGVENAGWRVKFAAVAGRVLDLLNDDKLLAPLDSAVVPLPHQIRCLRRVVAHPGKVRYLLADEVGLGKPRILRFGVPDRRIHRDRSIGSGTAVILARCASVGFKVNT